MTETIRKYSTLARIAYMAAGMVSYFASQEKRPMTDRENWEWEYHMNNYYRHSQYVAILWRQR